MSRLAIAITIPETHTAKQENSRRSPRSVAISRLPFDLLPCACPSCHSKDLAFVRCSTHGSSQIVSRLPHDLGAHCDCSHIASYATDAACGFGLAARHFVAVACDRLAGRRSHTACSLVKPRRRFCPPPIIDIIDVFSLLRAVPTYQPTMIAVHQGEAKT